MNYKTRSEVAAGEIRALLGRNRQTIKELSESTDIALSTLNRRLLGESSFNIDELDRIAQHFGVTLVSLVSVSEIAA